MLISQRKFSGSFKDFQETSRQYMPAWIEDLAKVTEDAFLSAEKDFLDVVSREWGILCMSQRRESILMWGHYCDKPLGLVIGFDASSAVFRQAKAMRPVSYVKERVVFDACWELRSPETADYENRILFSKSDEWSYEQEVRQAFQLRDLRRRPLGGTGAFGFFLPIPPETIISVTLGPRCSGEQENYVREVLKYNPLLADRRVMLDRARLDDTALSLRFEPVL